MKIFPFYGDALFQAIAGDAWRPGGLDLTRLGLNLCDFAPHSRLLDIGCGTGATLALLLQKGYKAVGLDLKNHCKKGLPLVLGNAVNPPFAKDSFDGLLCECVLSLLPDKDLALGNFASILKPGGKILLTDIYRLPGNHNSCGDASTAASCAAGAIKGEEMELALKRAGFQILQFTDHSDALKQLAAKLIWYGGELPRCACDKNQFSGFQRSLGYGLWLARLN